METTAAARPSGRRALFILWVGILGPPIIWMLRLLGSYILVPYACWTGQVLMLHGVSAVALLGAAGIGLLAWRTWRGLDERVAAEAPVAVTRGRFMALFGLFSAGVFATAILAEWLTIFFVHPCLV